MKSNKAQSKAASKTMPVPSHPPCQDDEERTSRIALAAYYKAEARDFQPGYEIEDWLAAEAEEK